MNDQNNVVACHHDGIVEQLLANGGVSSGALDALNRAGAFDGAATRIVEQLLANGGVSSGALDALADAAAGFSGVDAGALADAAASLVGVDAGALADAATGLVEQLRADVGAVAGALDVLAGADVGLAGRVAARAPLWAAQLLGGDEELAAQTVAALMCLLWPGGVEPPTGWWGTSLGRAVVRAVGHPAAGTVSYAVAAAVLGVTKTTVGNAVKAGRLTAGQSGGVTAASVREQLLRQDLLMGQVERTVADPSSRVRRGRPVRRGDGAG